MEQSLQEDPNAGNTIQSTNSDPRNPSLGPLVIPPLKTSSQNMLTQRMSRSLLEELFNSDKGDSFSSNTENSDSGMIVKAELLEKHKTELAMYLSMSLEALIEANASDNVERLVNSLGRESADAFQQNIFEDFINRLKTFKESVPKAISTLQSNYEFLTNYEKLNVELNTKLNQGQEKIQDLETKLSETTAEEYSIDVKTNQKIEILDKKNLIASQLDQCTQVVYQAHEKWKALGEEIKLSTDRWVKSNEDLAHAKASGKIFKEI